MSDSVRRTLTDCDRHFAAEVRAARETAGLTQIEVAKAAGVHSSQISRLERFLDGAASETARGVTLSTAIRIAAVLGISLDRLVPTPAKPKKSKPKR